MRLKKTIFLFAGVVLATIRLSAQEVGINTQTVHSSAIMEINAVDPQGVTKGLLPPRVALRNSKDNTTIPNPATGLMVYNTQNAGDLTNGRVYADNYYYWVGDHWMRMVYTPLVEEAVIPRVYYIEGSDEQPFLTEELNPRPPSGTTIAVSGVDRPVIFLNTPVIDRKGIVTKQSNNENFRINVTGTYDLSAFVNFNPRATTVNNSLSSQGIVFERRAFINLKIQKQSGSSWSDIVGIRGAWGTNGAGYLKTLTLPSTSVRLNEGDIIRLVIQSPYPNSSVGGGPGGTAYISTEGVLPTSKGFRAVLLDFDL